MELPKLLDGRLKVRHLRLVAALAEQGSVVGAAAELRLAQPAATRDLHELEKILGVTLYERGPRGVTPTIFGAAFTQDARAILAQLAQAGRNVVELADAERGTVAVGTHLAGSNLLIPRAIASLKRAHPRVTVIVREATPQALLIELEAGRVDFVVGRLTVSVSRSTATHRVLYDEPIRLTVRAGHPATLLRKPTLAELLQFPWILPGSETALRFELEQLFVRHALEQPVDRVECTSILTVRQLLKETDVIAALPQSIASDDAALVALPIPLESLSHAVGVTLRANRSLTPSAAALLTHLESVAADMGT